MVPPFALDSKPNAIQIRLTGTYLGAYLKGAGSELTCYKPYDKDR
jgi:hypothetical protein